jgi:hypothetical protein
MANIRKSFNFRNGVAVDDDDFIVRGSLVGIGTSVPSEIVDIRGTLKIVGTTTTRDLFSVGVATLTELTIAGTAITMNSSGVITAKEFYGNGATLLNLPTSQWQDVDVGLGFTSIYAVGNVGVATRDPRFVFQVGQANLWQAGIEGKSGVGINSQGDIVSSGIFTAFSFVGFGSNLQLIDADNIDTGTLDNDRLPIIRNDRFPPNVDITGIVTAGIKFSGILEGELVGIASTARSLIGSPDIQVGFVSAISIRAQSIEITGDAATPIPGISTVGGRLDVGAGGTGFTASVRKRVGIGVSFPTKNLQIDNGDAGSTFVEVASTSGPAIISIAQSITGGVGNLGGFLRYGDTSGEFDIYNKSPGNFNFLLHAGSPGINTGRFNWLNGQTFANLMSITYDGKVGVRIANPSENFHVVGTSTITGNAYFGSSIFTNGTITVQNTVLGDPSSSLGQNINVNAGISTFNTVYVANRLGIGSALPSCQLDARGGIAVFGGLGVGVTPGGIGEPNTAFFQGNIIISQNSTLGVGTTAVFTGVGGDGTPASNIDLGSIQAWNRDLRVEDANLLINRNGYLGIGTYLPVGAIDARYARTNATTRAPVYLPNMTTGERGGLSAIIQPSALIYNTSDSAFQYWSGTEWISLQGSGTGSFSTLSVTNTATIGGLLDANGGATIDNIRIGVANDNEIDTSTGNLTIDSAGGTTTIDDAVTITGAASLSSTLTVTGTTTLNGAAVFNGNIDLGNATTDTISFVGRVDTSVVPNVNLTRDLGTSLLRWGTVYANQFIGDGSGLTGIVATGSGVVIQDDGSPVGTAATINFASNLTVSLAGGVATIDASGGGSGVSIGGTWGITSSGDVGITTVKAVGVKTDVLSSSFMVQQFGIESKAGTFTATAGVPSAVDVIGISTFNFRTAEYTLYFQWNGNVQSQKVLCMHNGTTAFSQEYAVMYDPNQIVSVGSTISAGNFQLLVTPEAGVSGITTYTWTRHTVIRT